MLLRAPAQILAAFESVVSAEATQANPPTFTVDVDPVGASGVRWRFALPDTTVEFGPMGPPEVAQSLLTQFTRLTVLTNPNSWFLHAGVVAGPQGVLVAMAPSGTGKSTFVARLLQDGYRYLSDELAWIQPHTWQVTEYPKPLALDEHSLSLLAWPKPDHATAGGSSGSPEFLLAARCFESVDSSYGAERVRLLMHLTRGGDVETATVQQMNGAEKVAAVLDNQLNFMDHDDPLQTACDLVSNVAMAGIAIDHLDVAVSAVADAVRQGSVAELRTLVKVAVPAPEGCRTPGGGLRSRSFDPFSTPQPTEPLSVATFADGSAVVFGISSGQYAVTNVGGACLAGALGQERAIIDLAPACDVSVRHAEDFFTRLGEICLVRQGDAA